jgi:uncharacterized membrane protein (UPF0127 family)
MPETPRRAMPPLAPAVGCPADPGAPTALESGRLRFEEAGVGIDVEIVRSEAARARGLMYRKGLADDAGMLFVFPQMRQLSFWMRNTCIGLDMIFVAADGFIVGIEENVPTLNDNSYGVDCKSVYVIEVGAGWARRNGVRPGHHVVLP